MKKKLLISGLILILILSSVVFVNKRRFNALSISDALEMYKDDIIKSSRKTGVWASVTAAQFILESGNPVSALAENDNNYFGIKWADSFADKYPGAFPVTYSTLEDSGGGNFYRAEAQFTHFPTVQDCITEHSIIWWNGNYQPELDILYNLESSRDEFLWEVGNGPYATDSGYAEALLGVIAYYNLDELDAIAFPEGRKYCGYNGDAVGVYDYPDDSMNDMELESSATTYEDQGVRKLKIEDYDLIGLPEQSQLVDVRTGLELKELKPVKSGDNSMVKGLRETIIQVSEWSIVDSFKLFFITLGGILVGYSVLLLTVFLLEKHKPAGLTNVVVFGLAKGNKLPDMSILLITLLCFSVGMCLCFAFFIMK